jgi:arylsulfatase A
MISPPRSSSSRSDMKPALFKSAVLLGALWLASPSATIFATTPKPNIIIILADDLGYGDLSIQGHPLIRTPNIDRLAREGQRWTSFYASAPLCAPSRVGLMTGRLPIRMSGTGRNDWLPFPIPDREVTMAEMLKKEGYATGYVGKWGLTGLDLDKKGWHPDDQGFDHFFGLLGSNDAPMREGLKRTYENIRNVTSQDFPISLYREREAIETPVYQPTLTKRYTEDAVKWIREHKDEPFFLILAHSMPHVPVFRSPEFAGHSRAGVYGDAIEELDGSVGRFVEELRTLGIAANTLVFFNSDNGPWRTYYDFGGSSGPLRDGKNTAWEGGFRVPGIFWWPGKIKPAVIADIGVNVDLIRTFAALTGASLPTDRTYDSIDLSQTLLEGISSVRQEWFFYGAPGNLWAARVGRYKLVFESQESLGQEEQFERGYGNHQVHTPPLLFDLATDISERLNIGDRHPKVVTQIQKAIEHHQESLRRRPGEAHTGSRTF